MLFLFVWLDAQWCEKVFKKKTIINVFMENEKSTIFRQSNVYAKELISQKIFERDRVS